MRNFFLYSCILATTVYTLVNGNSWAENNGINLLNSLIPQNYSKSLRPNYGGPPTTVNVSLYVLGIDSISTNSMDFTFQLYFRHQWVDHRLAYSPSKFGGMSYILDAGGALADRIWTPDTFFANAKKLSASDFALIDQDARFIKVGATGEVFTSKLLKVTANCPMNLLYYPFDSNFCTLEMESYGYSAADIIYQWKSPNAASSMTPQLELPDYKILGASFNTKTETLSTGTYSRLILEIRFVRSAGKIIMNAYLPAFALVLVSFVPLALVNSSKSSSTGNDLLRVLFSALVFLAGIAHAGRHFMAPADISYLNTLDCYLITANFTSFLALASVSAVALFSCPKTGDKPRWAELVDSGARLLLPGFFLFYNVIHLINIYNTPQI